MEKQEEVKTPDWLPGVCCDGSAMALGELQTICPRRQRPVDNPASHQGSKEKAKTQTDDPPIGRRCPETVDHEVSAHRQHPEPGDQSEHDSSGGYQLREKHSHR
jgi:hypothetical protein